MKINIKPLLSVAGILLLLLSVACQSNETPVPSSASESPITGPTPVPEQAKTLAEQFARAHGEIEQDWDDFHKEFDAWREGLAACDPSAAQQAFRGFASKFNDVNEQTLSLSRPSSVRGSLDQLIEASQGEASALRRLRDRWQPGDTSLLEAVASQRVAAAAAQKELEDELADLQDGADAGSLEELEEFSGAFETLQTSWETFHSGYLPLKAEGDELEPEEFLTRLDELVKSFSVITLGVEDLPAADLAEDLAEALTSAADAQKMGLDDLQSEIKGLEEGASKAEAFTAFDAHVRESKSVLKKTEKELKNLAKEDSAQDTAAVEDFAEEFDELLEVWKEFHEDIDDWVDSEGGCDRSEVIGTLGEMSLKFGRLADRARNLPTASYLRPMGGLVVQAAEGEAEALRVLRNAWRPFGADVYKALDSQRADAGDLRRLAAVGVEELLDRFQVSLR